MMKLSKSDYLSYLQCPREFWLRGQKPEIFTALPDGAGVRYLKDTGYRVQMLAQELFSARAGPGVVLVTANLKSV